MHSYEIILSILVISHNQQDLLSRCLDSILKQRMDFSYEIIISDDTSIDNTWNIILGYIAKYPDLIFGYRVNSDECNPVNNSQRSGWNRCNAYSKSRGKYIIHIDADDYFIGTDVLQSQVEMLEKHSDCSLCMQNIWILDEGATFETGRSWFPLHKFHNEQIITAKEFIQEDYFIINQAFVMRRNPDIDPAALYGKRYVDSVITFHHLQFGNIVCVDHCDYVYVKHSSAITSTLSEIDKAVLWCLPIYIPLLIPRFTGLYFSSGLKDILRLVNMAREGSKLTKTSANSIKNMGAYIFDTFSNPEHSIFDLVRLNVSRIYLVSMIKLNFLNTNALRVLYYLIISKRIEKNVCFEIE